MLEILNMGGYAAFVWPAYIFALGLAFFLYKKSVNQLKSAEKHAKELVLVSEKVEDVSAQKQSA